MAKKARKSKRGGGRAGRPAAPRSLGTCFLIQRVQNGECHQHVFGKKPRITVVGDKLIISGVRVVGQEIHG